MLNKQTIHEIDLTNKRVLVRVDFNVPLDDGVIRDDSRILAAIPTLQYLLDKNAAIILCSHLGRPKGIVDPQLSLRPIADHLSTLLNTPVAFASDCIGSIAEQAANDLHAGQAGQILLLENTRFHPGEKQNDPEMARQLAALAEVFVNDAFGTAHRAHASNVGVAQFLPAVAGLLMQQEIQYLGQTLSDPKQPFIVILGGAKVSDKIGVIQNLLGRSERILIGGGMANTFFLAQGLYLGDSLVEPDAVNTAKELLRVGTHKLLFPVDVVIADEFAADASMRTVPVGAVPAGWRILDIGPETIKLFATELMNASTVVWNGPMGVYEFPRFAVGTYALAEVVSNCAATTIVGGGDSAAAIRASGLVEKISHISTGGGASLEMLEGKTLPGLAALLDK